MFKFALILLLSTQSFAAEAPKTISRRSMCLSLLAGSGVFALGMGAITDNGKVNFSNGTLSVDPQTRNALTKALSTYPANIPGVAVNLVGARIFDHIKKYLVTTTDLNKDEPSYTKTVMQAQMVLIGETAIDLLFGQGLSPAELNMRMLDIKAQPYSTHLQIMLIEPLITLVFNMIPEKNIKNWKSGVLMALSYAAAASSTDDGIQLSALTFEQFIEGGFYWYLLKERGVDHALIANLANSSNRSMSTFLNLLSIR